MNPDERCWTCSFFARNGYECHRHAPVVMERNERTTTNAQFPRVMPNDWCGDYIRQPEPT